MTESNVFNATEDYKTGIDMTSHSSNMSNGFHNGTMLRDQRNRSLQAVRTFRQLQRTALQQSHAVLCV